MDEFRKKQGRNPFNAVDGMTGGTPRRSSAFTGQTARPIISSNGLRKNQGTLDSFKRMDGFQSSQQPQIKQPEVHHSGGRQPRRDPSGAIDLSLPGEPPKARFRRRKHGKKKMSTRKRVLTGVALFILAPTLVLGFLFGKGYLNLRQIFKGGAQGAAALQDNVDPSRLKGEGDGRVNILLLGRGGDGHEAPDLTDTIIVASIDPVQKKAALLSIPRDLYVPTSTNTKINAVFADAKNRALAKKSPKKDAEAAGLSAIEKQVEDYMGIPIHYHVMVDFSGFEQAINTVGGVDINVAADNTVYEVLYDHGRRRQYILDVKQGQQHFDGQRALFYSRSRKTSNRGDFDRTERQRLVMIALKEKILSVGTFSNPVKVSQLITNFGSHVTANMTLGEVMRIYEIGKSIPSAEIASVGLADPPNNYVTTDNINGQSVVRPRAGLSDFSEIQNYVRNALRDGYLTKENATVAVFNGTATPGLAAKKGAELKSYGYTLGTLANAPTSTYAKTIVVDLSKGTKKYTKNYLEQRFKTTAVNALPDNTIVPGNADFVIIIGQDAVGS